MVIDGSNLDNYKCIVNILFVSYTLFYIRFYNFAIKESLYALHFLSVLIVLLEIILKVGSYFISSLSGKADGLRTNFIIGQDNEDKSNSRNRKSKVKISSIFRTICTSISSIVLTHLTIILFGAYLTQNFEESFTLSCLVASLVFIRPLIGFGSSAVLNICQDWNWSNSSQVQGSFVLLGSWLGAFLIPLDWNRPWQVWPLTCCIGALFGELTASVILLYDRILENRMVGNGNNSKGVCGKGKNNKPVSVNKNSSKSKQNTSKKQAKTKKNVVKSTLANPFTLDWPSLNYKDYTDITCSLKLLLATISDNYLNYKKEKDSLRSKKVKGEPEVVTKSGHEVVTNVNQNKFIGHDSLLFGYNEVMRGLEKGTVVSVLVNSKAKPEFIMKMFIPVCTIKQIPIILVEDLTTIVKDANIGIKSCLALGLKKDVTLEGNTFHEVYMKTCKALDFSPLTSTEESNNCSLVKNPAGTSVESAGDIATLVRLSKEQIKNLHLYRGNAKERIFKPKQANDVPSGNTFNFDSSFIRIAATTETMKEKVNPSHEKQKVSSQRTNESSYVDASQLSSTFMFTIDAEGDDLPLCKGDVADEKICKIANSANKVINTDTVDSEDKVNPPSFEQEYEKEIDFQITTNLDSIATDAEALNANRSIMNSSAMQVSNSENGKSLKKKRKFEGFCYIPTKVKRIRNNSERKKKGN